MIHLILEIFFDTSNIKEMVLKAMRNFATVKFVTMGESLRTGL